MYDNSNDSRRSFSIKRQTVVDNLALSGDCMCDLAWPGLGSVWLNESRLEINANYKVTLTI